MARTFVRLKLRLLRNGLRIGQAGVLFVIGAIGAGVHRTRPASRCWRSARGDAPDRMSRSSCSGSRRSVGRSSRFSGSATTRPSTRNASPRFPLTRRQLVTGVLAASLVGVAPLATLFAFTGRSPAYAHDLASTLLIAHRHRGLILLLCVVASRTLVAVLVPILRSRRGRDFTILAVTLLALMPPVLELFAAAAVADGQRLGATPSRRPRTTCASPRSRGAALQ